MNARKVESPALHKLLEDGKDEEKLLPLVAALLRKGKTLPAKEYSRLIGNEWIDGYHRPLSTAFARGMPRVASLLADSGARLPAQLVPHVFRLVLRTRDVPTLEAFRQQHKVLLPLISRDPKTQDELPEDLRESMYPALAYARAVARGGGDDDFLVALRLAWPGLSKDVRLAEELLKGEPDEKLIRELLASGADPNVVTEGGFLLKTLVLRKEERSTALLPLLLEYGADPNLFLVDWTSDFLALVASRLDQEHKNWLLDESVEILKSLEDDYTSEFMSSENLRNLIGEEVKTMRLLLDAGGKSQKLTRPILLLVANAEAAESCALCPPVEFPELV